MPVPVPVLSEVVTLLVLSEGVTVPLFPEDVPVPELPEGVTVLVFPEDVPVAVLSVVVVESFPADPVSFSASFSSAFLSVSAFTFSGSSTT